MNSEELYLKDGRSAGVWYCGECRHVTCTKAEAESCCEPRRCQRCQCEVKGYTLTCDSCASVAQQEYKAKRFSEATKLDRFDGPVFVDGLGPGDGYFESIDALMDWATCEGVSMPEYAWTCRTKAFVHVHLDRVIEDICEDAYEGWDSDDLEGIKELKAAVMEFEKKNVHHVSWHPDYSRAVLLAAYLKPEDPTAATNATISDKGVDKS